METINSSKPALIHQSSMSHLFHYQSSADAAGWMVAFPGSTAIFKGDQDGARKYSPGSADR